MAAWRELDGFTYTRWTEVELDELPMRNRDLYERAEECAVPGGVHTFRSDVARYEILWLYGGTYADSDNEIVDRNRLTELLRSAKPWLPWEVQGRSAANSLLHFPPKHAFVDRLIRDLPHHVETVRRRHGRVRTVRLTGPRYVTRQLRRAGLDAPVMLDEATCFPYGYAELDKAGGEYGDAVVAHHFANQRRIHGKELSL